MTGRTSGKNFPKFISNIRSVLIIPNKTKEMGETMPTTLVNDTCKKVVNINPSKDMNRIIPAAANKPKGKKDLLLKVFSDEIFER